MEKQGRLLVVDDDHAIRRLLERIAKRAGFDVDSAKDGVEALEMLDRVDYDVALIDLMMPRLSGYELVQKISTRERRPIVLVATALTHSDTASIDDSVVRHVIRKPFDVHSIAAKLLEAVQELAAKRNAVLPIAEPAPPPEQPKQESEEKPPETVPPPVKSQTPC